MSVTNRGLEEFLAKSKLESKDLVDIVPLISPQGDLTEIFDIDVIMQHIVTILTTPRGSYIFDPMFGSELYKYVFEPVDEYTQKNIEEEVRSCIQNYVPFIDKLTVNVLFLKNKLGFVVNVGVEYREHSKSVSVVINEELLKTLPEASED